MRGRNRERQARETEGGRESEIRAILITVMVAVSTLNWMFHMACNEIQHKGFNRCCSVSYGTDAKLKMNVMDTLGTMEPLRATINGAECAGFKLMGVIFNFTEV